MDRPLSLLVILVTFAVCTTFGEESDTNAGLFSDGNVYGSLSKRALSGKGRIRIGVYSPLICRHIEKVRKARNALETSKTVLKRHIKRYGGRKGLGFFSPIYCKGLENWLNKQSTNLKKKPIDCLDVKKHLSDVSGMYTVFPKGSQGFDVYCDMDTRDGGWTVFQRRFNGKTQFYRNWDEYKHGFGNLEGEFWLGNDKIHLLTARGRSSLRVELEDFQGTSRYASFSNFFVDNEKNKYKLKVAGYSGSAGDSLTFHNGQYFSTPDRDNDSWSKSCAQAHKGPWWYGKCSRSNLNSLYLFGGNSAAWQGVVWNTWRGYTYSLRKTTMMFKRH